MKHQPVPHLLIIEREIFHGQVVRPFAEAVLALGWKITLYVNPESWHRRDFEELAGPRCEIRFAPSSSRLTYLSGLLKLGLRKFDAVVMTTLLSTRWMEGVLVAALSRRTAYVVHKLNNYPSPACYSQENRQSMDQPMAIEVGQTDSGLVRRVGGKVAGRVPQGHRRKNPSLASFAPGRLSPHRRG